MSRRGRPPAPCRAGPPGLLLLGLALAGCWRVDRSVDEFRGRDEPVPVPAPAEIGRRLITPRELDRSIDFLADDDRRGRATPSPGLDRTAAWVAQRLQAVGVEPAGDEGGYIQYWPLAGVGAADSTAQVPNVVGLIGGADLTRADEFVVVVAPMDHLGVGAPDASGDSIYNGADAVSGLAGLVEIAEALVALPEGERVDRPVLFLAVSGREAGLAGAAWYAAHPTVALDGAVAVVALDRIARNRPDRVSAIGHRYSDLGPLLDGVARAHPDLGLEVVPDGGLEADSAGAWFRSADVMPLARRGVPSIVITTGDHEDHRRPSDEHGRTDPDKAARVARLAFLAVHRIAASELEPGWTPAGHRITAPR